LKGFLGTGATFAADLNLVAQMVMGAALIVGAFLARAKKFVAHGICQASVLLLNLAMIALVMWPAFQRQVLPPLPAHLSDRYYAVATAHGLLGAGAELLGLYIALVAGTNTVPRRLRFTRWKLWMRIGLGLWCTVLLSGIGTYYAWYIAAPSP
jgi:uncharacterized membrane protein YozB (DUF420 family)